MAVQDGLDDIQPQAHALPVHAAGFVAFVEAVEDERQLLRRDGLTGISYRYIGLSALGRDAQAQGGALGGKFDGVVQQIITHLGDGIRVAPDQNGPLGDLGIHIQMAGVDLGLQAHQHPQQHLGHIELFLGGDVLRRLQPRQVQHPPHQAGEPPRLGGNGLQGRLFMVGRDGAVQNAVGESGDGGHGRLELVGDIGHEFAAPGLALGDGVGHGVEGLGQLAHLVPPVFIAVHPGAEFPMPEFPRHISDLLQRLGLPQGGHRAGDEGDAQHHHGGKKEDGGERPPHLRNAGGIRGHVDHGDGLQPGLTGGQIQSVDLYGSPRHIALFREQSAQGGDSGEAPVLLYLRHHALGQGIAGRAGLKGIPVGGEDHLSVCGGHQDIGV